MAATSGSVFAGRPRTGSSKLQPQQDVDGNEAEVKNSFANRKTKTSKH